MAWAACRYAAPIMGTAVNGRLPVHRHTYMHYLSMEFSRRSNITITRKTSYYTNCAMLFGQFIKFKACTLFATVFRQCLHDLGRPELKIKLYLGLLFISYKIVHEVYSLYIGLYKML